MAKKHVSVSLRKPPPPVDLEKSIVDALSPQSDVRNLISTATAQDTFVAHAKPKPGFRAIHVELPEKVADDLAAFCAASGRDMNEVVAEILVEHLTAATAPSQDATATTSTTSTGDDAAPTKKTMTMETIVGWLRDRINVASAMRTRLTQLGRMVYASL